MSDRPRLLFYCQHSLGMGHLVRSLALAEALCDAFDVTLLSGGTMPAGRRVPPRADVIALPPLAMGTDGRLYTTDTGASVTEVQLRRTALILDAFHRTRPDIVLLELFPFGRKKFAAELEPMLDAAAKATPRPFVACSLRDILVSGGAEGSAKAAWSVETANRRLGAVLVHSDPVFASLEESFPLASELRVPLHYTGFVTPARTDEGKPATRERRVLVSAGGGVVGEPLFHAALRAQPALFKELGLAMRLVAGPFLPETVWQSLQAFAGSQGLDLVRQVDDLAREMRSAAVSVSQCGYNTSLDILIARVPALVVPYGDGGENEQRQRARKLASAGLLRFLLPQALTPEALQREVAGLVDRRPPPMPFSVRGAQRSVEILARLHREAAALSASVPPHAGAAL